MNKWKNGKWTRILCNSQKKAEPLTGIREANVNNPEILFQSIRWSEIHNVDKIVSWWGRGKTRTLAHCWWHRGWRVGLESNLAGFCEMEHTFMLDTGRLLLSLYLLKFSLRCPRDHVLVFGYSVGGSRSQRPQRCPLKNVRVKISEMSTVLHQSLCRGKERGRKELALQMATWTELKPGGQLKKSTSRNDVGHDIL